MSSKRIFDHRARAMLCAVTALTFLKACVLNEAPSEHSAESTNLVVPEANPASLELSAHRNNGKMRFDVAAREYQRLRLGSTTDEPLSGVDLKHALAQSNLGRFDEAEGIFNEFDETGRDSLSPILQAEADTFRAQHILNRWRYGSGQLETALEYGKAAIERYATASQPSADVPEDLSGIPDEVFAQIYKVEQTAEGLVIPAVTAMGINETLNPTVVAGLNLSEGLTNEQRRSLKEAHAHYVTSYSLALLGNYDEAKLQLESVDSRLENVPSSVDHWLFGASRALEGVIELNAPEPRYQIALKSFEEAERFERSIDNGSRALALTLLKLGETQDAIGDSSGAAAIYAESIELIEKSGGAVDLTQVTPYLQFLSRQPKSLENDEQIFRTLQVVQSLLTAQALSEVAFGLQAGSGDRANALRNSIRLREEGDALRSQLARVSGKSRSSREARFLREQIRVVSLREDQARTEAGSLTDALDSFTNQSVSLADFQRRLAPGEQVVLIQVGNGLSFVTSISADAFQMREADFTTSEATARVARIKDMLPSRSGGGLATNDFAFDDAHIIYQKLIAPSVSSLGASSTLTVIPTGALASLPFSILTTAPYEPAPPVTTALVPYHDYTNAPWLAKKVPTASALSLTALYNVRGVQRPSTPASKPFVGFGNFAPLSPAQAEQIAARKSRITPGCEQWIRDNGRNVLPNTGKEVANIKQAINTALGGTRAESLLERQFTDTAVRNGELRDYRVLHFATHGLLSTDAGNRRCLTEPALWTSHAEGDETSDALLGASEIAQLDLNADLVVLSACDTGGGSGLGSIAGGESLTGLTRSFFVAGARNIVASHWKVASNATQDLMESFYTNLATSDKPLAQNLAEARLKMIETGTLSHPFYWGAFTVFGDGTDVVSLK